MTVLRPIGARDPMLVARPIHDFRLLVNHRQDVQDDYYDKPYTRITPFTIGAIATSTLFWVHFSSFFLGACSMRSAPHHMRRGHALRTGRCPY